LQNAAPDESISEAHQASPPCHAEKPSPGSSSSEPGNDHQDCGCGDSYTAVLASVDTTFSYAEASPVIAAKEVEVRLRAVLRTPTRIRLNEADLPPPDILLLKSTLLI
jgi:hypothetical protein